MAKTVAILLKRSMILSPFDKAMITVEAIAEMRKLRTVLGGEEVEQLPGYKSLEDFVTEMREDPATDRLVARVSKMQGVPEETASNG